MSDLSRFLEIIFAPPSPSFRTVRGTLRHWSNADLADRVSAQKMQFGKRKPKDPANPPRIEEMRRTFHVADWKKFRVELTTEEDGQTKTRLTVVDGDQWWSRDSVGRVQTSSPAGPSLVLSRARFPSPPPAVHELDRHFDHAMLRQVLECLSLSAAGPVTTAGRECVRLRAVKRPGSQLWPHWLPHGAEEYELHADPQLGCLLFIAGKVGGEVFELHEILDVAFDEPLADELFTFTPTAGEEVTVAAPIAERLTLDEAIARMPFQVLVPARLPGLTEQPDEIMYHPPLGRQTHGSLRLMYRGGQKLWISESAAPDPLWEELEWEIIERAGRRLSLSDPCTRKGMRIVALEQLGTYVTITSDLEREELLDLAAGLGVV